MKEREREDIIHWESCASWSREKGALPKRGLDEDAMELDRSKTQSMKPFILPATTTNKSTLS